MFLFQINDTNTCFAPVLKNHGATPEGKIVSRKVPLPMGARTFYRIPVIVSSVFFHHETQLVFPPSPC